MPRKPPPIADDDDDDDDEVEETPAHRAPPPQLAGVDWGAVHKALVGFGMRRMHLRAPEAEDMAAEAIKRQYDPDFATWDPEVEPNLLIHLFGVMRGMGGSERQRHGFKAERVTRKGKLPTVAIAATAEDALGHADEAREALAALRARVRREERDDLVERMIALRLDGVDAPADQARALGVTVSAINNAKKRLDRHVLAIKASREAH